MAPTSAYSQGHRLTLSANQGLLSECLKAGFAALTVLRNPQTLQSCSAAQAASQNPPLLIVTASARDARSDQGTQIRLGQCVSFPLGLHESLQVLPVSKQVLNYVFMYFY